MASIVDSFPSDLTSKQRQQEMDLFLLMARLLRSLNPTSVERVSFNIELIPVIMHRSRKH
jgi:hypothetical protein